MTYYADLSTCAYFGTRFPNLIAIGWLKSGRHFVSGTSPPDFVSQLEFLAANAWQPILLPGIHFCDLCTAGSATLAYSANGKIINLGSSNIFVPSKQGVFVAPSLILHYIREHKYLPPPVFQDAVMRCPLMGSDEYMEALRSHGIAVPRTPRSAV